ncbi:MAG: Gfo/Idh/MocA family protein [Candidatus Bathyarchaeia archaeon]|jgi:predicted dehydrogenase
MKNQLRVLVVGCGFVSTMLHLPLLTNFKDVSVAGICELDDAKGIDACARFHVKNRYTDFKKAIAEVKPDLVDICTPPKSHAPLATLAIENQIPCVIEKPLTSTLEEADELIRLSNKNDVPIFPMHTYSYLPCFRRAKKMFEAGTVGDLVSVETKYLVNFRRERYVQSNHWVHGLPAGILFSEITPHLVMMLLDYLDKPESIEFSMKKLSDVSYVTADELHAILTSANRIGLLGLSYNSPIASHRLTIIGKKGVIDAESCTQTVVLHKAADMILGPTARAKWFVADSLQRSSSFGSVAFNALVGRYKMLSEGHRFLLRACISHLNDNAPFPVELEKCKEVVRILELLTSSAQSTTQKAVAIQQ